MKTLTKLYLALTLLLAHVCAFGQYDLNGSATRDNCRCYTLTKESKFETGSVWNSNKISLQDSFDFKFDIFFGCTDQNGADGMTFMLQPLNTSVGSPGEGLGFQGVSPGIAVTMDTWRNPALNDPDFDHISIQVNGNSRHDGSELGGPIRISATSDNVEDCKWHVLRVVWKPADSTMTVYFDNVKRLSVTKDIVKDIFSNDPMVYWGFTGSTGDNFNLQQFCTRLDPEFKTSSSNNTTCVGKPIQFLNESESFAKIIRWEWHFGDGNISYDENPLHTYSAPGFYQAKLIITGFDGCTSDTLKRVITVGDRPVASFSVLDTCRLLQPRISTPPPIPNTKAAWFVNGNLAGTTGIPDLRGLPTGNYRLQQVVSSSFDCPADTLEQIFTLHPGPQIATTVTDACINQSLNFSASQTDAVTTVSKWTWTLGDGTVSSVQNPTHTYTARGRMPVRTWAVSTLGCTSDTVLKFVEVVRPFASAGRDTIVYINQPFQLNGIGQGRFLWSPATYLSSDSIRNPIAQLPVDQQYVLQVKTNDGCVSRDTINIKVTKLLGVFIPTAFTPNGDGLNDFIHPRYYGVKRLISFSVFNRWGQQVFATNNTNGIWDGTVNGRKPATESFVWVVRAEDMAGVIKEEKGTILLIR